MKLNIKITLDSGGTVHVNGEGLSAEDVNEVFHILSGYTVESDSLVVTEHQDEPLPGSITDAMKTGFVEGFEEGRPPQETPQEDT